MRNFLWLKTSRVKVNPSYGNKSFVINVKSRHHNDSLYGHLQQINLQRASLYGPPNIRTLAATSCSRPLAAATSSKINHLQLFTTCSGHLQLFHNLQRPLAAATCSNIKHLQQCARVLRDSPLISKFYLFEFLSQTGVNSMCPPNFLSRMKYFSSNFT